MIGNDNQALVPYQPQMMTGTTNAVPMVPILLKSAPASPMLAKYPSAGPFMFYDDTEGSEPETQTVFYTFSPAPYDGESYI